jgi:hypothetical protein
MIFQKSMIKNLKLMIWIQAIFFFILNAIWVLPETIMLRNVMIIFGTLISLYEIYLLRSVIRKNSIPLILLFALFIWITIHLLFITSDFEQALKEYNGIWKRTLLGAVFAFGFAISIANGNLDSVESKNYNT